MTSRRNNMKKIAIMGARGFVGKALTAHLQDKYTVYPITREQFSLLDEQAVTEFFEMWYSTVRTRAVRERQAMT